MRAPLPAFPAEVALVVSNRPTARALDVARSHGVPAVALSQSEFGGDAAARDRAMRDRMRDAGVRLVVCAGYDRMLSDDFLDAYPDAILNVHPVAAARRSAAAWTLSSRRSPGA